MSTDIRTRLAERVRFQASVGEAHVSLSIDHIRALTAILEGSAAGFSQELRFLFDQGLLVLGPPRLPTADDLDALLPGEARTMLYLHPYFDASVSVVGDGAVRPLAASAPYTYFIPPGLAKEIAELTRRLRSAGKAMLRNALTRKVELPADDLLDAFETIYRDCCGRKPLSDFVEIVEDPETRFRMEVKRPLQEAGCPYPEMRLALWRNGQPDTATIFITVPTPALPAISRLLQRLQHGISRSEVMDIVLSSEHGPALYDVITALARSNAFSTARPAQPDWDGILPPEMALSALHLGHASLLLRGGSTCILADPWFVADHPDYRDRPLGATQLPPIDAVLLTHEHWDHVNESALLRYPPDVPIIVPRQDARSSLRPRYREFLELFGLERVIELGHWEQYSLPDGMVVTAIPFRGEGTAQEWATRNCYFVSRSGKQAFIHVDSSIDSNGMSDLTDGTIERIVNEFGKADVLYSARTQLLVLNCETFSELMTIFYGKDPRVFAGVSESCFCPAEYIGELSNKLCCDVVVLYSEGGADYYPKTLFLRSGDDERFIGKDYLWDSLADIADAVSAPVHLSRPMDAVLMDADAVDYIHGHQCGVDGLPRSDA